MKQRNKDRKLEARQAAFDQLRAAKRAGRKRPGSQKKRSLT